MPSKGIHFFATAQDMAPGLEVLERHWSIKYVLCGLFPTPELHEYRSFRELPGFGISESGEEVGMPTYLIVSGEQAVTIRNVPQRRGGELYKVDNRVNPYLLGFAPAGEYRSSFLIPGTFAPGELAFYEWFRKIFSGRWAAIDGYRVGPEAARRLDAGGALTSHWGAPADYWLKRRSPK
jgi:hypothetical protein